MYGYVVDNEKKKGAVSGRVDLGGVLDCGICEICG